MDALLSSLQTSSLHLVGVGSLFEHIDLVLALTENSMGGLVFFFGLIKFPVQNLDTVLENLVILLKISLVVLTRLAAAADAIESRVLV